MTNVRIGKQIPPGFSLDVEIALPAGVTLLYGPAGAGKTLALETIAGFARPDSGRILVEDALVFDAAARVFAPPRRRGCAYIPQTDALFPHMTLRRGLMFAAHRHPRLERTRRVTEMMDKFGLAAAAALRPREIPPEQKLRAAVAQALLAAPKVLLIDQRGADEPLLRLVREAFTGPVLVVSDDLDLACAAAEQLILLQAGRVVQSGAPAAVTDQPDSIDAARLLGIPNIFEGTIAALDPGRNSSRIEFENFALNGPYIPGRFRGARVTIAAIPGSLRVHPGEPPIAGAVSATLARVLRQAGNVRLEFAGGIFADLSRAEFERQKDNRSWQVEFPPQSLRVL